MSYVVLHTNPDMGDEGSYDGNVIGTFEGLEKEELTEASALRWVEEEVERMELDQTPTLTVEKHPHDSAFQFMVTIDTGFYEMHYHFQAV